MSTESAKWTAILAALILCTGVISMCYSFYQTIKCDNVAIKYLKERTAKAQAATAKAQAAIKP